MMVSTIRRLQCSTSAVTILPFRSHLERGIDLIAVLGRHCGKREAQASSVVEAKEYHEFPGFTAFGCIEATRVIDGKTETDARIFVLSRKLSPQVLLETARRHWGIENTGSSMSGSARMPLATARIMGLQTSRSSAAARSMSLGSTRAKDH